MFYIILFLRLTSQADSYWVDLPPLSFAKLVLFVSVLYVLCPDFRSYSYLTVRVFAWPPHYSLCPGVMLPLLVHDQMLSSCATSSHLPIQANTRASVCESQLTFYSHRGLRKRDLHKAVFCYTEGLKEVRGTDQYCYWKQNVHGQQRHNETEAQSGLQTHDAISAKTNDKAYRTQASSEW